MLMPPAYREELDFCSRWPDAVARLLRESPDPPDRVGGLAGLLHGLAPQAKVAAVLLGEEAAAVDARGRPRAEWVEGLRTVLGEAAAPGGEVALPPGGTGPVVRVALGDRWLGYLVLGPLGKAAAVVQPLLSVCAAQLAAQLLAEEERSLRQELQEELTETESLATLGMATDGVLHELGNYLNRMLLQAAIVQRRVPEERQADVAVIREEGVGATNLLRPLQQRRQQRRQDKADVDLNGVVRAVLGAGPLATAFESSLGEGVPPVRCQRGDLKRLLRFLLGGFLTRPRPSGVAVGLRTAAAADKARLLLQDAGPAVPEGDLGKPFDGEDGVFAGADPLERLAAPALLKETGGKLLVRNRPEGGVTVQVDWG
jgi:hypothetical protein